MRLAKSRCLAIMMSAGLGALLASSSPLLAENPTITSKAKHRLKEIVLLGSYDGDMVEVPSGWAARSEEGPEPTPGFTDLDPASRNPDSNPDVGGTIGDAVDMEGARLLYTISGGLAARDDELRIHGDGTAILEWGRLARGDDSGSIVTQLPESQLQALKALFLMLDFRSLPPEFEEEGNVADRVDYLVAAQYGDTGVKSVLSHTGAIEDPRFTSIRFVLDALISEIRAKDLLQVAHRFPDSPELDRRATLTAGGVLLVAAPGLDPTRKMAVRLEAAEVRAIRSAMEAVNFVDLPVMLGRPPYDGPIIELMVNHRGLIKTVTFAPQDEDPRVQELMRIVGLIDAARQARG